MLIDPDNALQMQSNRAILVSDQLRETEMALEVRGTVKRASNGTLVAEVPFGPTVWELKGQEITVDGTTARVLDHGSRFKRNGYAYVYLYLAEPAPVVEEQPAPVPVPKESVRPLSAWDRAMLDQYRQQQREDAEDRGELEIGFPGGIEVGHE